MTTYGKYQDALLQHNADIANPAVTHSHITARTDIGDHLTAKPLLATASGDLHVTDSGVGTVLAAHSTKLDTIATNTANIKISTDSVNLNVDTLEALIAATNTHLDTFSGYNRN